MTTDATRVAGFGHESASVLLTVWDDEHATVSDLSSKVRNKGHASGVLHKVINLADDLGLVLLVEVEAYENGIVATPVEGLSNTQLVGFYGKFGFMVVNEGEFPVLMERAPRA